VSSERDIGEWPVVGGGIVHVAPEIESHLHSMAAADPTEVVHELVGAAVVEVRRCLAISHSQEAVDIEDREALFLLAERASIGTSDFQALDAEGFDAEIRIGARAQFGNVAAVPPETRFVQ